MTPFQPADSTDPGIPVASARADSASYDGSPIVIGDTTVLIGTAGWTDPTLTASGVFYPEDASSAEARLRYYASRFSLVEVDATYYALPSPESAERWVERTPPGFTFDIKAYALMTGHPTEVRRLPKAIRGMLPAPLQRRTRVYAKDLPADIVDAVWEWFHDALQPLHSAGKLGAVLMQYPPWFHPSRESADAMLEARRRLAPLSMAVELRHRSWFEGRVGARTLGFLGENEMPFVMVDEPQGTEQSVPPLVAVTTPRHATFRLHGRKEGVWDRPGTSVAERFRYLYAPAELQELADRVHEATRSARRLHVIFNNCYANYAVANALELGTILTALSSSR